MGSLSQSYTKPPGLRYPNKITHICMDCKTLIEIKEGFGVTGTSHGLCLPCLAKRIDEFN